MMESAMPVSLSSILSPCREPLSLTLSRKREKGQMRKAILNPGEREQTNRYANYLIKGS